MMTKVRQNEKALANNDLKYLVSSAANFLVILNAFHELKVFPPIWKVADVVMVANPERT